MLNVFKRSLKNALGDVKTQLLYKLQLQFSIKNFVKKPLFILKVHKKGLPNENGHGADV
jgi:hypothetical protein